MGLHEIAFPADNLDSSNLLSLIITITEVTSGSGSYNAQTINLWVNDYGSQKWEYDPDDPFIVPSSLTIVLADPDEWLYDFFFGTNEGVMQKDALVELWLNSSQEFYGNMVPDSIDWDSTTKLFSFTATPKVEEINNQVIILDDETIVNPFSYSIASFADWPSFGEFLDDIFGLVNPSITVNWFHTWELYNPYTGWNSLIDHHYSPEPFYLSAESIGQYGLKTTGDVLRKLAFEWGCYAGLISNNLGFFREFRAYDSGNTMTLGTINSFIRTIRYTSLEYLRITAIKEPDLSEQGSEAGAGVNAKFIKDTVTGYVTSVYSGIYADPWSAGSPPWVDNLRCTRLSIAESSFAEFLSEYIWYHRGVGTLRDRHKIVDRFNVDGVNYRIDKNFTYNSINYTPILIDKSYSENITTIEAVPVYS
jgi:hypothetical protein